MADSGNFHDNCYRAGETSGFGSVVQSTIAYRQILESFLRLNKVQTVIDLACGDWQFSKFIPWENYGISYLGLDVSDFIVELNTTAYASEHCRFDVIRNPSDLLSMGKFDLVICKDVFQHIPSDTIIQYLDAFEQIGRHSLITNDVYPLVEALNQDAIDGGWRPIDLRQPPFSRNSAVLAEYHNANETGVWLKQVHLLAGR